MLLLTLKVVVVEEELQQLVEEGDLAVVAVGDHLKMEEVEHHLREQEGEEGLPRISLVTNHVRTEVWMEQPLHKYIH